MIEPLVKVIDVIQLSSGIEINIPCLMVTPVNPIDVITEDAFLSKQADTTASELTTNPRNLPVKGDVLLKILQPVYPAEKEDAAILIFFNLF